MSFTEDSSDPEWKDARLKISKSSPGSSHNKPKYSQKFCDKWLTLFKPWLMRSAEDANKPFCRACQTTLDCNRCHLQRHERTTKHARNLEILLNKGEGAARQNLSIRRERSKYYQQRKKLNSSMASYEASDIALDVTEDLIEEYDTEEKSPSKTDPGDDGSYNFVPTEAVPEQYSDEPLMKQEAISPVGNMNVALATRNVQKPAENPRGPKKAAKKERLKLYMQIQKDKNDLMDSFKELMCNNSTVNAAPPKDKNHVDLFFDSVSSSIQALSPKLIAEAKMRVSQLVCELELRALTENSVNTSAGAHTLVVSPQAGSSYIINQVAQSDNNTEHHEGEAADQYEALT